MAFSPVLMYPWHVSATSTGNVLITNKGEKFQSMWEVADLSTIITSSKLNHEDENEFIYNRVYVNGGKADWDTVRI